MKVVLPMPSNYLDDIFNQLMPELEQEDTYFQRYPHQWCICRDIPWICCSTVMTYQPLQDSIPQDNKPCLILLSTFEATYHGNLTPIGLDMVPSNRHWHWRGGNAFQDRLHWPYHPIQQVKLKGDSIWSECHGIWDCSLLLLQLFRYPTNYNHTKVHIWSSLYGQAFMSSPILCLHKADSRWFLCWWFSRYSHLWRTYHDDSVLVFT